MIADPAPAGVCSAWVDATAGVAGDMLLGALVDAGADLAVVQDCVNAVLPETVALGASATTRAGVRATKVDVRLLRDDQPGRGAAEIAALVRAAGLPGRVGDEVLAVFRLLADAEARVHGIPVERVHFHEVGAWDSVADVVGVCAALHHLRVASVTASAIALGSGRVRSEHGDLPVPGPAVLELVAGWEVRAGGEGELATPTGVALLRALSSGQGTMPAMTVLGTGVGAGTRDTPGRPNVVRVVLGTPAQGARRAGGSTADPQTEEGSLRAQPTSMVVLEANVDDLDPRIWPGVLTALLAAGAADAWLTPIIMKKGRPAHTLSVLAHEPEAPALRDLVLRVTSTIGVRQVGVSRFPLARLWVDVQVAGHRVAVKVAHDGGVIAHAAAEFEQVAAVSARLGRPVRDVLELATAAVVAAGLVPGAPVPARASAAPVEDPPAEDPPAEDPPAARHTDRDGGTRRA